MTPEEKILERLEALVQISMPVAPAAGKETDESRMLTLCDFNHTREEIAKKTGKPINRVDVVLNVLRKSGQIRSVAKDGGTVYVRLRR